MSGIALIWTIIHNQYSPGWGDAILGIDDGCIYWSPYHARRTLKHDPHMDQNSTLVGCDLGMQLHKWDDGALATNPISVRL